MSDGQEWIWVLTPITVILLAVIGALFKFGTWKGRVDESTSQTRESIDQTRESIDQTREFMGQTREFMGQTREFMSQTRSDNTRILGILSSKNFTGSSSPINLTELGQRVSKELGVKEWSRMTAKTLYENVTIPKREFEIHQFSENYVHKEFKPDENLRIRIQELAYYHGVGDVVVLDVFTIELRNALLEHGNALADQDQEQFEH